MCFVQVTDTPQMACGTIHPTTGIPCRGATEAGCEVTGLALLSPSRLLVADSWNRSVKIVSCDPRDAGVLGCITFPQSPFDLTITPGDEAAVTFPETKEIMIIQARNGSLKQKQIPNSTRNAVFNMYNNCYGIHCRSNRLYVTCTEDRSSYGRGYVVVLNVSDGNKIAEFRHEKICGATYVTTVNDMVYVNSVKGLVEIRNILNVGSHFVSIRE